MNSTYSFLDLNGVIDHPSYGSFNIVGQGLGEAVVSMATDKTVHDLAADGVVMISKMAGETRVEVRPYSDVQFVVLTWA